ncbi:MAG: hypothetical protein ACRC7S_08890 [Cetobacterium sp.]
MDKIQELEYQIENLKEELEEYKDIKRAIRNLGLDEQIEAEVNYIQQRRINMQHQEQLYLLNKAIERAGLQKHIQAHIKEILKENQDDLPF